MTEKPIHITQISATFSPSGPMLFGLGSDGRVYLWSAANNGQWLPNWNPPAPQVQGEPMTTPKKPASKKKKR